jgi:hypothetical protein
MAKVVHIINPTAVAFTAGPAVADVPAYSVYRDVTLSDAEFGSLMNAEVAILIKATASSEETRLGAKMLADGRNPGTATVSQ